MCVATVVAVAGVATAAGGAAYSAKSGAAASKQASEEQRARNTDQTNRLLYQLDPTRVNDLAIQGDASRAARRIQLQKELDPALASLRDSGLAGIKANLGQDNGTNQLAEAAVRENLTQDPRILALKDSLLNEASKELAAGASLPPEFQAELVRAGLQQGGQSGVGATTAGVGSPVAKLIGTEGIKLKLQRQEQATRLTEAAQNINTARANILSSIFPRLKELQTQNLSNAETAFKLAQGELPQSGLSGSDLANVKFAQVGSLNNLSSQAGDIASQAALNQGAFRNQIAGSLSTGVQSLIGNQGIQSSISSLLKPTTPVVNNILSSSF